MGKLSNRLAKNLELSLQRPTEHSILMKILQ